MEGKKWWASKTIIFNVITAIISVAGAVASPEVAADPKIQSVALLVITVGNTVLRLITSEPITKGESK